MTEQQMKNWIDNATYEELLRKWRFTPSGDPMFEGEVGAYYAKVMGIKRGDLSHEEQVATSKRIGWGD